MKELKVQELSRKEYDQKFLNYVGVDEAGRGCCAGSMFFVGTKLKSNKNIEDYAFLCDSKKTSKLQRKKIIETIFENFEIKVIEKTSEEIDKIGLSYAISSSLEEIKEYYDSLYKEQQYIYDGNTNYKVTGIETLIKGDDKVTLISASSLVAKYLKDINSEEIHNEYPEYGFIHHSGYVNKVHTEKILEYGYTKYHRKSYKIKAIIGKNIICR